MAQATSHAPPAIPITHFTFFSHHITLLTLATHTLSVELARTSSPLSSSTFKHGRWPPIAARWRALLRLLTSTALILTTLASIIATSLASSPFSAVSRNASSSSRVDSALPYRRCGTRVCVVDPRPGVGEREGEEGGENGGEGKGSRVQAAPRPPHL